MQVSSQWIIPVQFNLKFIKKELFVSCKLILTLELNLHFSWYFYCNLTTPIYIKTNILRIQMYINVGIQGRQQKELRSKINIYR